MPLYEDSNVLGNPVITARKRSLRRLCFYTRLLVILFTGGVCLSVCWDSRPPFQQQTPPQAVHAGRYGQQVGGMHPTGMHICVLLGSQLLPCQLLRYSPIITARKGSLGQGNIFTPVCHSVHRGGMRGCSRGSCVVAPRGVHGCSQGGMHGCSGGHAWLLPGGHVWLLPGGVCMAKGGMHGEGGHVWRRGGVCGEGGAWQGGVHGMHPPARDKAGHCAGGTHPTGMHSCLPIILPARWEREAKRHF